jgi:hypothetical protein
MNIPREKLRAFFKEFATNRVRLPKADGNVYEFYVFLQVCRAMRHAGLSVSLVPSRGVYKVRASPGAINSQFGHAKLVTKQGLLYELHNGIEISGQSGMNHEADIVLLGDPVSQSSRPLLTIECKLYGSASRLKGESRKAIGTVLDWTASAHESRRTRQKQGCFHCGTLFPSFFATNVQAGLRPDIEQYLAAYEMEPAFGLFPRSRRLQRFHAAVEAVGRSLA